MAASSSISLNFLPLSLRKGLLDFQKDGVRFGISKQGRCLIGDEMGLGKTLQAISIAYYYKDAWPLLIVVPSSVKFSWIEEIEKWLPEVEPHDINLIRSGSDISNLGRAIHVIGYGLFSMGTSKLLIEALESQMFSVVILDESHYLKTAKAARTKRLHQLCKKAKHAILLSGTPSLARPRELYFQLDIVCPGKFGSLNSFAKRYCDAHYVNYRGERHYDTSGASNLNELYNLLKMHVMIRRLKKEVLTQLPPKRRQKVTFDISESSSPYKKELQQIMKDFKTCSAILKGSADNNASIQSPLFEMNRLSTLLYHYTGLVKIGPVLKYIEDLAQGMDSKFIVFFRHRLVRQAIVQKLVTLKIKHICIAGDVPSSIRGDLVHSFQTDPQVRIAVLSIEAASFGLTLTAAHHVVFAELHHTPGVIIQAEDRAHRIGQTLPVNVHYLIARGTVDEILWSMIRRKVYVTSSTLDGVCKELQAEDGDEDQCRQLSACAAWVQDQEEDVDELEEFVMAQIVSKTKQDHTQTDLRSFFTPSPSPMSSQSNYSLEKQQVSSARKEVKSGVVGVEVVSVQDSDDDADDFCAWNDVDDDDALMSVSLEVPEEKKFEESKQAVAETLQGSGSIAAERKAVTNAAQTLQDSCRLGTKRRAVTNVTETQQDSCKLDTERKAVTTAAEMRQGSCKLDTERKAATHSVEESSRDENCALKPKMLKFKKEKDGKLTFARSKSCTKPQKKETEYKVHSLEIVGNDADSESQTLQSYLDDECESGGMVKDEKKDGDMEKTSGTIDDYRPKDRGFFASLQDADVECVAVVCKKTSSITAQSNDLISEVDSPMGASERDESGAFDDEKLELKQDASEKQTVSDVQENVCVSGNTSSGASSLASPSCKLDSKTEQVHLSTGESCTLLGDLTESSIQLDSVSVGAATEQVDDLDRRACGNKTVQHLSREDACSFLNRCENELDVGTASPLPSSKVKGFSEENEFPPVDHSNATNEDADHSSNLLRARADEEFQSFEETDGVKRDERSLSSLTSLQQMNEVSSGINETEEKGDRKSILIDEDSSDDFEVFNVKETQSTRPALTQMPPKKNKQKGKRKSNNKRTIPKGRCFKNNKQPPSWACGACTFINDGQLLECSICFTPRVTAAEDGAQIADNAYGEDTNDCKVVTGLYAAEMNLNDSDFVGTEIKNKMFSGEIAPENDGSKENKLLHESAEAHSLSSVAKERSVFTCCKGICNTSTDEVGEVENSALPPWSCSVCTFFNMSEMIECSMCLTPRRRSQRLSARKILPEDNESKSKSSRKRRHKRDAAKMDGFQRVDLACNSTLKRVHENSSKITVTDRLLESGDIGLPSERMGTACCDADTTLEVSDKGSAIEPMESSHCVPDGPLESNDESLTPEPMETRHDNPEGGYNCASKEHSTALKGTSNSANPRPRKRLKLEECEDVNTPDIYDFSEDLGFCSNNRSFISESPLLAYTSQKGILHCAVSKDVVKNEKSEHQPVLLDKSNCDKQCDLFERTDHSVDATSEISVAVSVELSSEVAVVEETNSRLHVREGAQCKVIDNLEELKAAAEEVFISEWEDDDDSWWEEDSSSEQSSYPSSGDTTSNSQSRSTKLNTGFTKCSDLYSISELKNRLQSTPEQSKAHASTGVGNNQRLELFPEQKVLAAPLHQENCVPAVDEEEMDEPEEIPESIELKFCLSFYTERVYLYNEDNKPLGINFCMSDVLNGNTEDLPTILHHVYNLKQVKRFLGAWKRMGEGKKRVLRKSALVFDDPLEAYERARKGATREPSYVRHPSKETRIQKVVDAAEEIGGNVRVVKKPRITTKKKNSRTEKCQRTNDGQSRATSTPSSSTLCTDPTRETNSTTKEKTCYQAVRADGIPLCLFCSGPVEFAERLKCSDWDKRFCSLDCNKEYQVRVNGTAARRALFEAERGVCQLCCLDAHSLYLGVTALHIRDRPAYLAQTPYASLPQQTLKKMVMQPKEGMFWEADHITPVSEGGGECGLDNLRTLCVMCHRRETGELNRRLKQYKALQHAAGYADISTFFRPLN